MITCYDISFKRTVCINPRYVVSMVSMEDSTGKSVDIHLNGAPFMVKVKENAREIEEIKEFFKNYKEED